MSDLNDFNQKINDDSGSGPTGGGTVWDGENYHGCRKNAETPAGSGSSAYGSAYGTAPQQAGGSPQTGPYYGSYDPYSWVRPQQDPGKKKPKKPKKHTLRRVLVGVLACLVVSAGSVAAFAALVNNGTVRFQQNGSGPAFTIVKSNPASSTPATNASVTAAGLTKQQVAQKVLPSVVCIENYGSASSQKITRGSGDQFGFTFGGDDDRSGNDGQNGNGSNGSDVSPESEGSGIIASADGYIITNAHVVSGAAALKVVLYNGKTYSAKLIGSDSITDLALIKINASGLTAAEFGSSDSLQVADSVMAVGNPGGLEFNSSVTIGYVSALNREITNSDTGFTMKCIQTDAAINPGNSGGALVNMKGQVIGINSSKIVATGYEGLGFAIPINTVQPIVTQLKQYGYVKDRAMLGVVGGFVDSMTASFYGLTTGYYIKSIASQYITAAGIQEHDIITKIDGKAVTSQNFIMSVTAAKKPGDTVTLTVYRASTGKTFTATVKLTQATGKS